ncbi:hypothetical protein Ssi02_14710 [Sinosporangium siamense]|uniref:Aminoglycoside phosphotransferase domain-containing protein n=1 Tax=Sinosporangium siamense TaxID=1367973 RepID=A0A919RC68_9ACTN|nr:hypothetical protein Ssi02_14710 [Sinosporangium siamense]
MIGNGVIPAATRAWVERHLREGESIAGASRLRGGWTSEMRRLTIAGPYGSRQLVLRSLVKPFYVKHAHGLLSREAGVLRLLAGTEVPAADLVAADPAGEHCEHPSLLMTSLPGRLRLDDPASAEALAHMLVRIHRVPVDDHTRPRAYQAWTSPDTVRVPADTVRPDLWRRASDLIRREPPA